MKDFWSNIFTVRSYSFVLCAHISTVWCTDARFVFWAGLGDGLLRDWRVFWNISALGQVKILCQTLFLLCPSFCRQAVIQLCRLKLHSLQCFIIIFQTHACTTFWSTHSSVLWNMPVGRETKRSGTEASICVWLIIHSSPHPPHSTLGCTDDWQPFLHRHYHFFGTQLFFSM